MNLKVAVFQESPVFFDKRKTLQIVEANAKKYGALGYKLLVFPESFIPGYPRGFTFGATVGERTEEGRKLYEDYYKNSISLKGNDLKFLEEVSRKNKVYLVIGITEKEEANGSLYCSMVYLSPKNGFLGVHRKIKPTGTERLIWAEGDGSTLSAFQTDIGRLGGLICWENYMPLARMSMYIKGVQIYIAPTADSREEWSNTMKQIALEGRCFVLGCNQFFTRSMYPENYRKFVNDEVENICPGGSLIVSPRGEIIAGPLFGKAGVLTAELDLDEITRTNLDFDVNGHYARKDIFNFQVVNQPEIKKE